MKVALDRPESTKNGEKNKQEENKKMIRGFSNKLLFDLLSASPSNSSEWQDSWVSGNHVSEGGNEKKGPIRKVDDAFSCFSISYPSQRNKKNLIVFFPSFLQLEIWSLGVISGFQNWAHA